MNSIHRLLFVGASILLAAPSVSHAKLILITHGDTISNLGEVSPKSRPQDMPANFHSVGFKYHYGGLFWIDFITSDGEFCVYDGDHFVPISKSQAAGLLGVPESELDSPFWYRYPPGWFVGAAIVVVAVAAGIRNRRKKKQVVELLTDARYQKATDIFLEAARARQEAIKTATEKNEPAVPTAEPWDEAIAYLVAQGIDKAEAEQKFGQVLAVASAQSTAASG
jgi:hypothetical protein